MREISATLKVDVLFVVSVALNAFMVVALRSLGSQMYPFFIIIYAWIAVYALYLAAVLYKQRVSDAPLLDSRHALAICTIMAISIRLLFLGFQDHISLDAHWYLNFGRFMQMGELPYTGFYFPYPPVFAYFIGAISWFAPTVDSFRVLAIIMDAAVLLVLWKIANRLNGPEAASLVALAYALLPIAIIESGWNGHFEPLTNLLLLLAIWFMLARREVPAGAFLGLAAATKIYPILLFPIMFFYFKGWTGRLRFLVVTVLTGALTFLPFVLPPLLGSGGGSDGPVQGGSLNPFLALLGSLFSLHPQDLAVTVFAMVGIAVGSVIVVRELLSGEREARDTSYNLVAITLGIVLIVMGVIAGTYPLLPAARMLYWRYPVDVGIVRGLTAGGIGLSVVRLGYKEMRRESKHSVTVQSLFMLVAATILLFASLSRDVFYGWYLLWAVPFVLLLKNKKMGLTLLLCILLIYPSYTHDNFASLGYQEERIWSDEMMDVRGWSVYVNTSDTGIPQSSIRAGVYTVGERGRFWFDTTEVDDETLLENVSIEYSKSIYVLFDESTEFVTRIKATWDPTFGRHSDLSLSYVGIDQDHTFINGTIIPQTSIFTNLTSVLWRHSLALWHEGVDAGAIYNITLTVHPQRAVRSAYYVDYFYTTYGGPFDPLYFAITPVLVALALLSYVILDRELTREDPQGTALRES